MKIQFPFKSIVLLLALVSTTVDAQHPNLELAHAIFQLEMGREISLQLEPDEAGSAEYAATFTSPDDWSERQIFIRISGIHEPFDFWINSFKFGSAPGEGFTAEFNITPMMDPDLNQLRIATQSMKDLPGELSCISASLIARDDLHVRDLEVTDYLKEESGSSLVRFHLWAKSYLTERNKGRTLQMTIKSPSGETIGKETRKLDFPISFRQEMEVVFDKKIQDPVMWSPINPVLYSLEIDLTEMGEPAGELVLSNFGMGEIQITDSILVSGLDTMVTIVADKTVSDQLCTRTEKEILDLIELKGYNVFLSDQLLPEWILDLFDRTGILVLRNSQNANKVDFRWETNHPCIRWIE